MAYKTEIDPTPDQTHHIIRTLGTTRHLYNLFLAVNEARYAQGLPFWSAYTFDPWVNHVYALDHPWIKEVSSKARKKALMDAESAYKKFFKHEADRPRFKKKHQQNSGFYAPKNNPTDWTVERHRVKIPTLGWVRLKEFGYLPPGCRVVSGTVTQKADRFFVSITVQAPDPAPTEKLEAEGIGVDLGIKDLAVTSTGTHFANINHSPRVRRLEKQLRRAQRTLSRRLRAWKIRGKHPSRNNVDKAQLRVQKLSARLARIRAAYRMHVIQALVKTKPAFITLETLNVQGMLKNRHLAKAIRDQGFAAFQRTRIAQAHKFGVEVREVPMVYPSSKRCSRCGTKKPDLTLQDRVYVCAACGYRGDRDENAALNLRNASSYAIAR
jgi:putative transposase